MSSTRQFHRVCELVLGRAGSGLKIPSDTLRMTFKVEKTATRTPNTALIKVYNLSPDHERIVSEDYHDLFLNAGYRDSQILLFAGNIKHVSCFREGNDRITEIQAGDGDHDFHRSTVNFTLAAGSTTGQLVDHALSRFYSTKRGHIELNGKKRIRGRVVSGMARDALDAVALENEAHWSIQDGLLTIVRADSALPDEAIVLSAETGLIGAPEFDDKGISAKCLLNPRISPNRRVWLNNAGFRAEMLRQPTATKTGKAKSKHLSRLDRDGIYKVTKVVHSGDTRGNDWFSAVSCVSLGGV